MQEIFDLLLDWADNLAYVFKEVPRLLEITFATLNQFEALRHEVHLVGFAL